MLDQGAPQIRCSGQLMEPTLTPRPRAEEPNGLHVHFVFDAEMSIGPTRAPRPSAVHSAILCDRRHPHPRTRGRGGGSPALGVGCARIRAWHAPSGDEDFLHGELEASGRRAPGDTRQGGLCGKGRHGLGSSRGLKARRLHPVMHVHIKIKNDRARRKVQENTPAKSSYESSRAELVSSWRRRKLPFAGACGRKTPPAGCRAGGATGPSNRAPGGPPS